MFIDSYHNSVFLMILSVIIKNFTITEIEKKIEIPMKLQKTLDIKKKLEQKN